MSYKYSALSQSFMFLKILSLWFPDPCKLNFQLFPNFRTKIESFVRFKKIETLWRLDQGVHAELLHIITPIFLVVSFSFVFLL